MSLFCVTVLNTGKVSSSLQTDSFYQPALFLPSIVSAMGILQLKIWCHDSKLNTELAIVNPQYFPPVMSPLWDSTKI